MRVLASMALGKPDCLLYIKVWSLTKCWPLFIRNMADCLPSLFWTKPTAGWFWVLLFRYLPGFLLLLFWLLGQRYVWHQRILWWIWVGFQLLYLVLIKFNNRTKLKSHKSIWLNKINKQNEDVSRSFVSTHRYEVNQSTCANLNGSTPETETPWWNHVFELVLILRVPDYGVQVTHRPYTNI